MYTYYGSCSCGETKITLKLPTELKNYSPRKCDCDFCMENNLVYLSDPLGNVEIATSQTFNTIKQGSEQAIFLACSNCKNIVGPIYDFQSGTKGAINANLLELKSELQKPTVISPKHLAPEDKLARWKDLWLEINVSL